MSRFEKCLAVVPYLRHLPSGTTLERVLERLQSEAGEYPERYRQLAAIRYYLHFMLWDCERRWNEVAHGVTNYKTLLDQIERWRKPGQQVCLVTFNYDTMLEGALRAVGITIQNLGDYIASEDYKVIKLHGSVNWAREVDTAIEDLANRNTWQVAYELIDRAANLDISRRYCIVGEYPIGKTGSKVLFPAIALPVETKRDYECPEEHLEVLRACVKKATKLLLIGWRASEEHFLQLLRDNLPAHQRLSVMAVSGGSDEARQTTDKILQAGIRAEFALAKGGFSDFIVQREGDDFLSTIAGP